MQPGPGAGQPRVSRRIGEIPEGRIAPPRRLSARRFLIQAPTRLGQRRAWRVSPDEALFMQRQQFSFYQTGRFSRLLPR
jgi:hypothetical protein